jgi:anti-sigma regulatory factor (Ser/Thr protein kinase)
VVPSSEHDEVRRGPVTEQWRLFFALPAELTAAAQARTRLGAWLDALRWPADQQEDLVLAVSEAVSNSVEHGYGVRTGVPGRPGVVEVVVEVVPEVIPELAPDTDETRYVEITVRDHGKWRAHPRLRSHRRHGIPIMKACVAECVIDGTATGTTVVFRSRPVPA